MEKYKRFSLYGKNKKISKTLLKYRVTFRTFQLLVLLYCLLCSQTLWVMSLDWAPWEELGFAPPVSRVSAVGHSDLALGTVWHHCPAFYLSRQSQALAGFKENEVCVKCI